MSRNDPQVNVRMSQELLDALRASATATGRTLTAEISHLLNAGLGGAPLEDDGRAYKPRTKITPEASERIRLMARITGKTESEVLERLVLGYIPTQAEARALAAIKSLDEEPHALEPIPNLGPEPPIFRALEKEQRAKRPAKSASVVPIKPKER